MGIRKKLIAVVAAISFVLFSIIAAVDWFRIRQNIENDFLLRAGATASGLEVALTSGSRLPGNDVALLAHGRRCVAGAGTVSGANGARGEVDRSGAALVSVRDLSVHFPVRSIRAGLDARLALIRRARSAYGV